MAELPTVPPAAYDAAQLFREHASRVERLLARLGVRPCDIPDATQEVFVVAHRRRHDFEGRASVSTWLYRISVRVAAAQRRLARHRRELVSDTLTDAAVSGSDVALEAERRALLEHLAAALEQLSEPQRQALALHDLDGLRMREVAARLGVPTKTAFSRVYAARRALTSELRRMGYALPGVLPLWPSGSILARFAARATRVKVTLVAAPQLVGLALCALMLAPPALPLTASSLPQRVAAAPALPLTAAVRSLQHAPRAAEPPSPVRARAVRIRKPLPVAATASATVAPPQLPAQPETEPDIVMTRMGSEDLRPVLEHPFAGRVQPARTHLSRMSARLAPRVIEPVPPADFD